MKKQKHRTTSPITKKHMTLEDRITIQTMLQNRISPTQIAKGLGKSASTITRELENRKIVMSAKNDCEHYNVCSIKNLCKRYGYSACKSECKYCKVHKCSEKCKNYVKAECEYLSKAPHLCNGCNREPICFLEKSFYKAKEAQEEYQNDLTGKRDGFDLTEEQICEIDRMITPLIKAGQSPYAIATVLKNKLPCGYSTLYRLIQEGRLSTRNIDLIEKVKRRPRKRKHSNKDIYAVISKAKEGHLWKDWLKYYEKHKIPAVQMDCVEGKKEDVAVLLTLHWKQEHMQLFFIMDKQDSANVVATLNKIEESIGLKLFKETFPVILTDNGHEFADVEGIEASCTEKGEKRTLVFFCEPNRSDEKGECERNHRVLRRILPKNTDKIKNDIRFDDLMQEDVTLITNHVNSYVRPSLQGVCPYDLAMEKYDEDFFILLGLERIDAEKVILTPDLIKKRLADRCKM